MSLKLDIELCRHEGELVSPLAQAVYKWYQEQGQTMLVQELVEEYSISIAKDSLAERFRVRTSIQELAQAQLLSIKDGFCHL